MVEEVRQFLRKELGKDYDRYEAVEHDCIKNEKYIIRWLPE